MIAVDTSALIAILSKEPEWRSLLHALSEDGAPVVSALTLYETMIVCSARRGSASLDDLNELLATNNVRSVPFDDAAVANAHAAYLKYGKGRHPAGLNLCDCSSYALAKSLGVSLLFKGNDFARTDVEPAVTPTPPPASLP